MATFTVSTLGTVFGCAGSALFGAAAGGGGGGGGGGELATTNASMSGGVGNVSVK
jgi:hypothetical protein